MDERFPLRKCCPNLKSAYPPQISFDSGSDEDILNRFEPQQQQHRLFKPNPPYLYGSAERIQQYSPNANRRRHSSYSHEDILNLKYQPQPTIDPRYRDSRPFVNSSSNVYEYNARRDFFSRRRSSSSLHEDVGPSFKQFQRSASPPEGILRKSNPTLTNSGTSLSDKSNTSRWDLNPAIFIEEYNDDKKDDQKSNASSTNLSYTEPHQPLNEETVASFVGFEEIPFIDDEMVESSDNSEMFVPEMVANDYKNRIESVMVHRQNEQNQPPPPLIRNRKTVSFDLMEKTKEEEDDDDDDLNNNINNNAGVTGTINKSRTCDHITNIQFSDTTSADNNGTNNQNNFNKEKSIFKFCTFNKPTSNNSTKSFNKHLTNDSDNDDSDSLSAYFYNDDNNDQYTNDLHELTEPDPTTMLSRMVANKGNAKKQTTDTNVIDEKSVELDLSGLLTSDSTTTTTTVTTTSSSPQSSSSNDSSNGDSAPPTATPTNPNDIEIFIKKQKQISWVPSQSVYDKLPFGHGKVQVLRRYFENMQTSETIEPAQLLSVSSPDLSRKSDRLSTAEKLSVMEQLREWSEFGIQANSGGHVTSSTTSLSKTNTFDMPTKASNLIIMSDKSVSVPDVNDYELTGNMIIPEPRKKFPDAYIIRKKGPQCNVTLSSLNNQHKNLLNRSFPELFPQHPKMVTNKSIYLTDRDCTNQSPCMRSRILTLRKIKHSQTMKKLRNNFRPGDVQLGEPESDGSDEAR